MKNLLLLVALAGAAFYFMGIKKGSGFAGEKFGEKRDPDFSTAVSDSRNIYFQI